MENNPVQPTSPTPSAPVQTETAAPQQPIIPQPMAQQPMPPAPEPDLAPIRTSKGISLKLFLLFFLLMLIVGTFVTLFVMSGQKQKPQVSAIPSPTTTQPSKAPAQNPFEEGTQSQNPFDATQSSQTYQNPFSQ